MKRLVEKLQARQDTTHITVTFPKGRHNFYPDSTSSREYYISNHDQDNSKKVGLALEGLKATILSKGWTLKRVSGTNFLRLMQYRQSTTSEQ
ncbi:MAG: hypothetical protein PHN86_05010 [Proteiniphilum sp.]|nr:hypothetical protein [Proteiniphilum sp.]